MEAETVDMAVVAVAATVVLAADLVDLVEVELVLVAAVLEDMEVDLAALADMEVN